MVYARTQKFFSDLNNNIVAIHFDHTDNTLTATFVGSTKGFLQLRVVMVYNSQNDLENFQFSWITAPEVLATLRLPVGFMPSQIVEVQEWTMMSDSAVDTVFIRNEGGAEFEIKGDPDTNFG